MPSQPVFKNFADLMQGTLTRGFVIPGDYGFLIPRCELLRLSFS